SRGQPKAAVQPTRQLATEIVPPVPEGGAVAQGRFFWRKSLPRKAGSPAPRSWRREGRRGAVGQRGQPLGSPATPRLNWHSERNAASPACAARALSAKILHSSAPCRGTTRQKPLGPGSDTHMAGAPWNSVLKQVRSLAAEQECARDAELLSAFLARRD